MKKEYSSPEFDIFKVELSKDVLTISDPDPGVNVDNPTLPADPGDDPFDD